MCSHVGAKSSPHDEYQCSKAYGRGSSDVLSIWIEAHAACRPAHFVVFAPVRYWFHATQYRENLRSEEPGMQFASTKRNCSASYKAQHWMNWARQYCS
jgi:hypothetical protein